MDVNAIAIGDELVYRSGWYPFEHGPRIRVTEIVLAGTEEKGNGIQLLGGEPQYVRKSRIIGTVLDPMVTPFAVGSAFLGLAENFSPAPELEAET